MSGSDPSEPESRSWSVYLTALVAGSLAMVVQVCCTRIAVHYFGSDSSTIAASVAAALSGLAFGAILVGRPVLASQTPSKVLAMVFVFCAVMVLLMAQLGGQLAVCINSVLGQNSTRSAVVFALLTLLPLNVGFGAVLPLLVNRVTPKAFGLVYGVETLGAALGGVMAAFFWMQSFGLYRLMLGCSAVAFVVGLLSLLGKTPSQSFAATVESPHQNWVGRVPVLIVVALTSIASLGMEVVWQRYYVVWFGSDTKSFAIVVATILIGISLGSSLASRLVRDSNNLYFWYRCVLIAMAFGIVGSTYLISIGFENLESLRSSLNWLADHPVGSRFILAMTLLLLPTTLLGFGLPIAAAIWIGDSNNLIRSVGQLYAAAVVGNILGVVSCGFYLIPNFGLRASTAILGGLCMTGCAIVFVVERMNAENKTKTVSSRWSGSIFFLAIGSWVFLSNAMVQKRSMIGLGSSLNDWQVDYYSEYSSSTVAVIHENSNPEKRKMLIDGVSIGESIGGVDEKQQLLAHLPFLLNPFEAKSEQKQRVLTIGLGTGILAGELVNTSSDREVCCVEISPAVIEAAKHFSDLNGNLFERSNFNLIQGDGLVYLRNSLNSFDVIVSDAKSRPGHSGNITFFSRDYYEICNRRLSENGTFIQWISLKSSGSAVATILKTFCGVFPYGHVGIVAPDSIFVVGTRKKIAFDPIHIGWYLNQPFSRRLRSYNFTHYHDILSLYWLDQTGIENELKGTALNSFDRPVLDSYAFRSFKQSTRRATSQLKLIDQLVGREMSETIENSLLNGVPIKALNDAKLLKELVAGRLASQSIIDANQQILELEKDWLDNAAKKYKRALDLLPGLTRQRQVVEIYRQLAETAKRSSKWNLQYSALLNIRELEAATAEDEFAMAKILQSLDRNGNALDHFYQAVKKAPQNIKMRNGFAYCLLSLGKQMQAASQFKRILAKNEDDEARVGLGISQLLSGFREAGIANIQKAIEADASLQSKLMEYQIENW